MNTTADLTTQIEQLVQAHLAAVRAEAEAAVVRAFAGAHAPRAARRQRASPASQAPRRSPEELERLSDALLELVEEKPGSMMVAMAPKLGLPPRALQRPMERLKQAGRVRSVGQRHQTRYFPVVAKS